ncbi:uncharacterized protein BT62DRAFT_931013 [Guyanagaster necrorhizus]|uniref:Uncharacterized protein n=1 Tax=Guyanagaster necrorhizus TaxID=856835 RepID=A0A9P7VV81_9AGAR|nr:uncharacterized protein BT62DRAFT_931013 [Guyanagaster necrorhizus MCA 3950]KAG7447177.1 hypothetical protein BT62DRAFT_931013 [Guyanagaster necrorhizus MCA 3950]
MDVLQSTSSASRLSSCPSPSSDHTYLTSETDRRWSDIVPPKNALTFAVIWDPEEDIVAFSGAHLLDSEFTDVEPDCPTDANSFDASSTLAWFMNNHDFLFDDETDRRRARGRTQTSSTIGGLDVYIRSSRIGTGCTRTSVSKHFSCLGELNRDIRFDPRTEFAKRWEQIVDRDHDTVVELDEADDEDEGFYDTVDPVLPRLSHASVDSDDSWSQLEAPEDYAFPTTQRPRLLRKPRPRPVHPTHGLQQDGCNYNSSILREQRCRLLKFIFRWKKEKEPWVCIEMTKEITQTYV